jgi:hypothetical protein
VLDAIGKKKDINWEDLIGSHKYFAEISGLQFPPLYDLAGFADLFNDFWHTLVPPKETTGQCNLLIGAAYS